MMENYYELNHNVSYYQNATFNINKSTAIKSLIANIACFRKCFMYQLLNENF